MKKFVLGFLVGALLFSAIPISAAVKEYVLTPATAKLVLDGEEMKDDKTPMLYLSPGYNYIPAARLRVICEKIGVGFEWDGTVQEIRLTTDTETTESVKEGDNVSEAVNDNQLKTSQKDGYLTLLHNDMRYINTVSIETRSQSYRFDYVGDVLNLYQCKNGDLGTKKLVFDNVQYTNINGINLIEYSYFQNTILPLLIEGS